MGKTHIHKCFCMKIILNNIWALHSQARSCLKNLWMRSSQNGYMYQNLNQELRISFQSMLFTDHCWGCYFFATSTYNLLLPSIFGTNVFMWQIVRMLWFISSCLLGTIYKSLTHKTKIWHNDPLSTEFGRYPFYFFCCFLEISAKTGVWLVQLLIMWFLRVMVCHILHTFFSTIKSD